MKNKITKYALSIMFVVLLGVGAIKNNTTMWVSGLGTFISTGLQNNSTSDSSYISILECLMADELWHKYEFIELNGFIADLINLRGFYSNDSEINVLENNYVVSQDSYTSTDFEFEQTMDFKKFLDENGINFLYVNEPTKYLDDSIIEKEFGIPSYSNKNADTYLNRIKAEKVNAIDLRENITKDELDIQKMFYKTDHHWTVPAGLWATRIMADGLNNYCGYEIDTSIYDISRYSVTEYKDAWLGEQGRKLGKAYVGLDDYTCIVPNFDTDFTFKKPTGDIQGDFSGFVDYATYDTSIDVHDNNMWHYSYVPSHVVNNNVSDGKLLLIGDSYELCVEPFLALGVNEVDFLVLREKGEDFDLRHYILENGYDTVMVAYAQFMIGAHDNPESSNYRMFVFK